MNTQIVNFINNNLPQSTLKINEPMAPYTTFKIGGPADLFFIPSSVQDLQKLRKFLYKMDFKQITVVGGGSNMLVSDKGIRGLVILISDNLAQITASDNILKAEAGASMKDASYFAAQAGLTGLEFAVGIPGNVGGGTFMNAGAYEGDFSMVVDSVYSVDERGNLQKRSTPELHFAYRHSAFQDNQEIITQTVFKLQPAPTPDIIAKINDLTQKRESKQPLDKASAGSTFKRPVGYFAGTMIEQSGLKGHTIGGAQVSQKHAGFVINTGTATAQDVLALIAFIQKTVLEKFNVQLESEVRFIGER